MPDVQFALSESAVDALFQRLRDRIQIPLYQDSQVLPRYAYRADFGLRVEGGRVTLEAAVATLRNVDVVLDPADFAVSFEIPRLCVGGFVLGTDDLGIPIPQVCLIDHPTTLVVGFDLGGRLRVRAEAIPLSFALEATANERRTPGMTDHEAFAQDAMDTWDLHLALGQVDLDLCLANEPLIRQTLSKAIDDGIDDYLEPLVKEVRSGLDWLGEPDWGGDPEDFIELKRALRETMEKALRVGTSSCQWLTRHLGITDLAEAVLDALVHHFAEDVRLWGVPQRYPVVPAALNRIPVLIPLESAAVGITDAEVIVSFDVGG